MPEVTRIPLSQKANLRPREGKGLSKVTHWRENPEMLSSHLALSTGEYLYTFFLLPKLRDQCGLQIK